MKLSERLKQDHESGDNGNSQAGLWEEAAMLEETAEACLLYKSLAMQGRCPQTYHHQKEPNIDAHFEIDCVQYPNDGSSVYVSATGETWEQAVHNLYEVVST